MNTNKEAEWRRFIVPKKVEQINDHLFIDTYKSAKKPFRRNSSEKTYSLGSH